MQNADAQQTQKAQGCACVYESVLSDQHITSIRKKSRTECAYACACVQATPLVQRSDLWRACPANAKGADRKGGKARWAGGLAGWRAADQPASAAAARSGCGCQNVVRQIAGKVNCRSSSADSMPRMLSLTSRPLLCMRMTSRCKKKTGPCATALCVCLCASMCARVHALW